MRILFVGDIFGERGVKIVEERLFSVKKKYKIDFCIANAENATNGRGLGKSDYNRLKNSGIEVMTMGNHVWGNADFESILKTQADVMRPYNVGDSLPGAGFVLLKKNNIKIAVGNLEGRAFVDYAGDNPFFAADKLIKIMENYGAAVKIIDFHAEATSEKKLMAFYTDGRVSAVLGTHTHVQTADEQIMPGGTAFITDVGMTGISNESVLGMQYKGVSEKIIKGFHAKFVPETVGKAEICGVVLEIDEATGKALSIERIRE